MGSTDGASVLLVGPDTLSLRFAEPPASADLVRDYFLVVDATPLDPRATAAARRSADETLLPSRFALRSEPNPFGDATTIRFELPVGEVVRIEVFDAQGRRIASLAHRYFPAGRHAILWQPAAGGIQLKPGALFCRIEAGAFRDRVKLLWLP